MYSNKYDISKDIIQKSVDYCLSKKIGEVITYDELSQISGINYVSQKENKEQYNHWVAYITKVRTILYKKVLTLKSNYIAGQSKGTAFTLSLLDKDTEAYKQYVKTEIIDKNKSKNSLHKQKRIHDKDLQSFLKSMQQEEKAKKEAERKYCELETEYKKMLAKELEYKKIIHSLLSITDI